MATPPVCASIALPYRSGTDGQYEWRTILNGTIDGYFDLLTQTANGYISGIYTGAPSGFKCTEVYNVAGSADGNGEFSVSGTDRSNPPGVNCPATFTGTITISGSACASGTIDWRNSLGQAGTDGMVIQTSGGTDPGGIMPTGETSYAYGVLKAQPATMVYPVTIEIGAPNGGSVHTV